MFVFFQLSHLPEKPLVCDICKKSYRRLKQLRKHMLTHKQQEAHVLPHCLKCSEIFASAEKCQKHIEKVHKLQCKDDLMAFKYFEIALCCEYCDATFEDAQIIIDHRKKHTSDKPFECQFCLIKYDKYSKLKTHSYHAHKETNVPFPIERHYLCDDKACLKTYRDWRTLQCHRKTVHLINPTIFKCKECDATFYRSWDFAYHKKSVHSDPLPCVMCDKTFSTSKSLQNHITKIHVNNGRTSKRNLPDSTIAEAMERIEATENAYKCLQCNKICVARSNAINHVAMVHMKVVNFKCSVCKKGFFQRGDLNDHMRIVRLFFGLNYCIVVMFLLLSTFQHTQETPFACTFCDYKSRKKSMLILHQRYFK